MAPGLGVRIWNPPQRVGVDTGPINMVIPEPDKLDKSSFQLTALASNLVCRIFGRNNSETVLNVLVLWDDVPMEEVIFLGDAGVGKPFAGIWALFGQPEHKGKLDLLCGKSNAGCCAIRAGSLAGAPSLVGTDYENALTIDYPIVEDNLMVMVGGCLDETAHPVSEVNGYMATQWQALIPTKQGTTGGSAYFGSTFTPSPTGTFTLEPQTPQPGIIVVAEWNLGGESSAT